MRRIYLDHTATTPLDARVFRAMEPYFSETFGNASSIHRYGREARQALEQSRAAIAALIGAEPGEIYFTSGGTEGDNLAIRGVVAAAVGKRRGIVTSGAEHHAVLDTCENLATSGVPVTVLKVNPAGSVDADDLRRAVLPTTALVSLMHGNNEVGTISPVAGYADIAHTAGALFHTDAVQTAGRIPVDVQKLGVDLLTLSAHKMYGPKGIGALYVKKGTPLEPILRGGGQERGRRPGTENVALAVGFAEAFRLSVAEMEAESDRLRRLRNRLEELIRAAFPGVIVNGDPEIRLPHILNISFDSRTMPMEGEMLVINMDLHGIAVTSGSACTSGSMQPSHVLLAMGRDPATAKATIRFSFGRMNTEADVDETTEALKQVVEETRGTNREERREKRGER
ncbi:MAG: cysteine desulfurase family protein [Bacteroidota bacterium]